jgi:hypothetical protein
MRRLTVFLFMLVVGVMQISVPLFALPARQPRIFVKAEPGFALALATAFNQNRVPAIVVSQEKNADFVLKSAPVASARESGASILARCLLVMCVGIEGRSNVSVRLIRINGASVVWAYRASRGIGGPAGIQSLSEAVAKHLKSDFLERE